MALMYIPRQRSPWEQMLPSFLSNITMQGIAHRRQQEIAKQLAQQKKTERLEGYMAKGWRPATSPSSTAVEIAGTMMEPPKIGYEQREANIGGKKYPVFAKTVTPFRGKAQVTDFKVIDPKNPPKVEKIPMYFPSKDPAMRRKVNVDPSLVEEYKKAGAIRGTPYGPQTEKEPKKENLIPAQNLLERKKAGYLKTFGAPRNLMNQIMNLDPKQRQKKLRGWLHTRNLIIQKKEIPIADLNVLDQQIMTELGIDEALQQGLRAATLAGASTEQLLKIMDAYKPLPGGQEEPTEAGILR